MKLFESNKAPMDVAQTIATLFKEFKPAELKARSQMISPSGLNCQVACAFKLTSAPMTPHKESFQSNCFAVNGGDRHKRLQAFLKETPYWVDVAEYIKEHAPELQIVEPEEGAEVDEFEVMLYSPQHQARFKCDGLLLIEGHYYVLEIKTERQSANSCRTAASPAHEKQGVAYTLMLNTDRILWLYEGRDFFDQKLFVQIVTKEEQVELDEYIKEILFFKDTPEELKRNTKACTYCDYANYCKMYFRELKKEEIGRNEKCQK